MKNKGFTLVELMITVAIVGILTAMGYPSYKNYITRVYLTEGLSVLSHYDGQLLDDLIFSENKENIMYFPESPNRMIESVGVWTHVKGDLPYNTDPRMLVRGELSLSVKKLFGQRAVAGGGDMLRIHRFITTENRVERTAFSDGIEYIVVTRMTEEDLSNGGFKVLCGLDIMSLVSTSEILSYMSSIPKECRNLIGFSDHKIDA